MAASAVALTGLVQRSPFSERVSEGTLTTPLPIRRRGFKLPAALPVVACTSSWQKRRGRRRKPRQPQPHPKGRIDTEFDLVVVPTDGISMSGSESDVSDWSVGWMEPHHANFLTDNELEDSFAVLVPCYGSPSPTSPKSPFTAENQRQQPPWAAVLANLSKHPNQENKRHLENWLACL